MTTQSLARIAALTILTTLPSWADSLSGKVTDPQGAAVSGASLSLFDRNSSNVRKTAAGEDGVYSFADIGPGTYILQVQTSDTALTASEEIAVNGNTSKDISLSLSTVNTRVVVSATGTPVFEQEVARVIDVIDVEQIQQRNEFSVGEVMRGMPGIQIQTQVGGITQIRTRGLPNQYTAVLIDGMRFRDAVSTQGDASGFVSDMNVTDMGRVEFMRGSGSSLYGTNAVAGAINLTSNDGGGRFHGNVRAEGGGLGLFRGTMNLAGGTKSDRFVYSGGASSLNLTGGVRGATPQKNNSGQLFGKYNFSPRLSLSARVWGSDAFQRSVDTPAFTAATRANYPAGTGPVTAVLLPDDQLSLYERKLPFTVGNANVIPSVPDPDGARNSSFGAGMLTLRHDFSPTSSWRASYSVVDTKRAFRDGPAGAGSFEPLIPNISNSDGRTNQLQLRYDTSALRLNHITAGYEFERESMNNLGSRVQVGGPLVRTTGAQNSNSYYAQDQVSLFDNRLQIVFGGRIQQFDLKQPVFSAPAGNATSPYAGTSVTSPATSRTGDVSVAYLVAKSNTKLRAHFGNGYRAPSLFERFGSGFNSSTGTFSYFGDPRLASERSKAFDTGIDQYLWSNKVRASATFFYTDLNPTIIFGTFPTGYVDPFNRGGSGYFQSPGGSISRGVELSTQLTPTRNTQITSSYTYVNADNRFPTNVSGFLYFPTLRMAKHMYSLTATQWITRQFNVTTDFYALSAPVENPFGANRLIAFPGPKKLDLVGNYRISVNDRRSVDVYVKVENLTNRRYSDNGFLAPQAWAIAGLRYNF